MDLIKISHLTKSYKASGKTVDVLKDVNLTLPDKGLIVVLGKSGSGKSTLLNLIGNIDKASKGKIKYCLNSIHNRHIKYSYLPTSFIFQHYNLLENETPLFNVMLPGLIQGFDKHSIEKQSREYLKAFKLDDSVIKKETRLLSGGEKERIAILRALITNPQVILADEPTGALDGQNAIKTMNILKKASRKRLVLVVTHNNKLANEYADRIITLSDGRVIKDEIRNEINEEVFLPKIKYKGKNNWSSTIVNHNLKKRFKRNVVSIIGMTISLTFCYLLFGFNARSEKAINEASKKHFDYGTCLIRKEITTPSSSSLTLVKTLRPSLEEMSEITNKFPEFDCMPNYDAILNSGEYYVKNQIQRELITSYVYSFQSNCFDKDLIVSGNTSKARNWKDVVINKSAYDLIKNDELHFKLTYQFESRDSEDKTIVDSFEIDERLNIIAIVDEFEFLAVPKIYFDYQEFDFLFENAILENYSEQMGSSISWKDLIISSEDTDDLSSYSNRLFLRNINESEKIDEIQSFLRENIKIENDSLTIKEALSSLTLAASYGLDVFLVITLLGSTLILGVFAYSAYVDDKKESSILSCLGASKLDIVGIFASESLLVTFLSFIFATGISYFVQKPLNMLLQYFLDIPTLIEIPFSALNGIRGFLPLCIFVCSMFITLTFTVLPILFNKSISIKKELSDL